MKIKMLREMLEGVMTDFTNAFCAGVRNYLLMTVVSLRPSGAGS